MRGQSPRAAHVNLIRTDYSSHGRKGSGTPCQARGDDTETKPATGSDSTRRHARLE